MVVPLTPMIKIIITPRLFVESKLSSLPQPRNLVVAPPTPMIKRIPRLKIGRAHV